MVNRSYKILSFTNYVVLFGAEILISERLNVNSCLSRLGIEGEGGRTLLYILVFLKYYLRELKNFWSYKYFYKQVICLIPKVL
jgi:hypothetical protein